MSKINLKHCLFCGNGGREICYSPRSAENMFSTKKYVVKCNDCHAHTGYCDSPQQAVERWNIRAQTLDDCTPVQKLKNERGAGRKPKLNGEVIKEIEQLWYLRWTHREIAEKVGLSVGTICKVVKRCS